MAVWKCKMCGGDLTVEDGSKICECEFCGTRQTIPSVHDEGLQTLFNRANTLRMKSEFDKAAEIYEKIIQCSETEADAYWGLILCKYGIEYVEDPVTFKRIPTCHRASYEAVTADEDFKNALKYADSVQRGIYEAQAAEIDEIQRGILALAQKEDPYDVFICYKETDEAGMRTQDSVIANDIYYQLVHEGYKVFYAAISLEDKLGKEYEPYIFSALNTAKVMLVIGTRPEYFNAVWVKNEWSRYLALVKTSRGKKTLIPAYKDMDPYDLPEEFSHLQALDISKLGFMQDLIRGIKKIIRADEPKTVKEKVVTAEAVSTSPLLKRAFIFLEDGNFEDADEYCEKVLDREPENANAYLGKLMAELKVHQKEELRNCRDPFDGSNNYQKIMRFGNEALKKELQDDIEYIHKRNERERIEGIYQNAVKMMNTAWSEAEFKSAAALFISIKAFKDSDQLSKRCFELAEIARKNLIYSDAVSLMTRNTIADYETALQKLRKIIDWKDAEAQIIKCNKGIEAIQEANRKAAKTRKIIIGAVCFLIIFGISFYVYWNNVLVPKQKYNDQALTESEEYTTSSDAPSNTTETEIFGTKYIINKDWLVDDFNDSKIIYFQAKKPEKIYNAIFFTRGEGLLKGTKQWAHALDYLYRFKEMLANSNVVDSSFSEEIFEMEETPVMVLKGKLLGSDVITNEVYIFMNNYEDVVFIQYQHNFTSGEKDYSEEVRSMVENMQLSYDGFVK